MKEIIVSLNHFGITYKVGILAKKDRNIYFEYDKSFLETTIEISPIKLAKRSNLFQHKNLNFSELFGVFYDSLPDGWGLLLQDRILRRNNINPSTISLFDRLNFIGDSAIGALSFSPKKELVLTNQEVDLFQINKHSLKIYEGEESVLLDQLVLIGGSPAGARPKVLLTQKDDGMLSTNLLNIQKSDKHWIIKFDVSKEFKEFSKVEYLYSLLAKDCGIEMPYTKLFKDETGNSFFGIERFDRYQDKKIHIHSFGSLIESNFRIPSNDYEDLFKVSSVLTRDHSQYEKIFRLMCFNVIFHNRDDHVKNFSFLMNSDYSWSFAPAYDLTPSSGPGGEHSMSISGKGKNIEKEDLLILALKIGIKKNKACEIIDTVYLVKNNLKKYFDLAELSKTDIKAIKYYL